MTPRFKLRSFRYASVVHFVAVVNMLAVIAMWIAGACLSLDPNEFDQIVQFSFTTSIFDIVLLSSFVSVSLFICVSELEATCLRIVMESRSGGRAAVEASSTSETVATAADYESSDSNATRRTLHWLTLVAAAVNLAYTAAKFGVVSRLMFDRQADEKKPMDDYYYKILSTELGFAIVLTILALLSWRAMRRLSLNVYNQLVNSTSDDAESNKPGANRPRKVNVMRLISLSYPEKWLIFFGFLMLILSATSSIVMPFFFGLVIDAAQKDTNMTRMNMYVVIMFASFAGGSIAGSVRAWLFELAGQRVVCRLRKRVFASIINQDVKFFDTNRTGELISRISSDSQVLQNTVTTNVSMLARYLIQVIGSVIFMFTLQPSLTGLLLGIIPVSILPVVAYGRFVQKLRKRFQDELAASSVVAEESISSARTVRSFAAEKKVTGEYEKSLNKSLSIGKQLAVVLGGFNGLFGLLIGAAMTLVLWYGGKLVYDKKITTGLLASFLMYALQVALAFGFLSSLFGDFMQSIGASHRIFELFDTIPEIALNKGFRPMSEEDDEASFDGSVYFDKVNFAYPTRDALVLKDITFTIEQGKTIALVGPSGGGKSTIFALIERFYNPNSGAIEFGPKHYNLSMANTNWLHSKIGIVSQEPVLFGGSIRDNIMFGVEGEVDQQRVIEVAKLANAHEFIESFEKGYDTLVGERGIRLSGGQKQRIAIARALLVNPKLLLLDEATSALDSESEHLVQEAIDRAMKNRTVCVVAHRLSTVRNADKVIVLDKGSVVEQGNHNELCELNGIYKRLVLRQLLTKDSTKEETALDENE